MSVLNEARILLRLLLKDKRKTFANNKANKAEVIKSTQKKELPLSCPNRLSTRG